MQITEEKLSKLNPVITLTIDKEDYQAKVTTSLKKYSKQASIKGFRPGAVPAGLIKKMYGNSILADEINKIIEEQLELLLKEHTDHLIGHPIPRENSPKNEIDINSDQSYTFVFEYGLRPDFTINLDGGSFELQQVNVGKDTLNKEVERMQKRMGTISEIDAIQHGEDLVYITLTELAPEKETPHTHQTIISVNDIMENKKGEWMGKKVGETITANPFEIFDNQKINVGKFILNVTDEQKAGLAVNFSFAITKITTNVPAELNEDFFKKASGKEDITTLEQFESTIQSEIQAYYERQAQLKLGRDIFQYLIENTAMELPIDFLKRYLKRVSKNEQITDAEIESQFKAFSQQLKWDIISAKLAKENDLKVDAQEIREEIRNQFIHQLQQYGMTYYTEDMLKNFVDKSMQDRKQVQQTYEVLLDNKIIEMLRGKITPSIKPMTEEAFEEDSKKRQEKMMQEREQSEQLFASDAEEETATEQESGSSDSSILGNVKNLAGKLFKGNI